MHTLKIWPQFFQDVKFGRKTFEFRVNDRPYAQGDTILLREFDPDTLKYSGRSVWANIDYMCDLPMLDNWVGMSISLRGSSE